MRSTWAIIGLVLVAGADARAADREARARALFSDRCAMCHTVGQGVPLAPMKHKVDLTLVARRFEPQLLPGHKRADKQPPQQQPAADPLRDFIKEPWKLKPDSRCGANHLDDVQLDLLVAFLKRRARPPQAPAPIPPAQFQPPRADDKPHVPTGPGEHR